MIYSFFNTCFWPLLGVLIATAAGFYVLYDDKKRHERVEKIRREWEEQRHKIDEADDG
jgi:hypothetical protein